MYSLFVGVDVSKDFFSAAGLDTEGKEVFSISYAMRSSDLLGFLKTISSHCETLDQVMVARESTGCYHIDLFSFLIDKGIHAVVVNPLLIVNFAKLSLRKTKTDKKDALTIAGFLIAHKDSITQISLSQNLQDLRDLLRERESLCHMVSAKKTEIKRLLRTTFPELESLCDPYTRVMFDFLTEFPLPRLVKAVYPRRIAKALRRKWVGTSLGSC